MLLARGAPTLWQHSVAAPSTPHRYIPQRWLLYVHTAPAIIYILCQISDYSTRMRVWVVLLNVFMLGAGGLGTIPWISWPHKGACSLPRACFMHACPPMRTL